MEIAEEIKKDIFEGRYKPGDQLPAEIVFAQELGVSRATLREAYSMLERQGYILRKHGVGSFVAEPERQIVSNFEKLESIMDLIRRAGYVPLIQVLESGECILDAQTCQTMEIPLESKGYRFSTIYSANGIPFVYTNEFIPADIMSLSIIHSRQESEDLADFITKNTPYPPVATLTRIKGILPTKDLMDILMVDANTPIIRQRFILYDRKGKVVGCGYDYFNSSWFEFTIFTHTTRL